MNLKEYLSKEKISYRTFSKVLKIDHHTVYNICKGKRPSKKHAYLIERLTKGEVKAQDLLNQEPWKRIERYC